MNQMCLAPFRIPLPLRLICLFLGAVTFRLMTMVKSCSGSFNKKRREIVVFLCVIGASLVLFFLFFSLGFAFLIDIDIASSMEMMINSITKNTSPWDINSQVTTFTMMTTIAHISHIKLFFILVPSTDMLMMVEYSILSSHA